MYIYVYAYVYVWHIYVLSEYACVHTCVRACVNHVCMAKY